MVVVEKQPWSLVVGDGDDLGPALEVVCPGLFSAESGDVAELGEVS
jgi:hypothetical protein